MAEAWSVGRAGVVAACVATGVICGGSPARGQSTDERAAAHRYTVEAMRAFQADRYPEAYRKARAAYGLVAEPDALYVMGKALFACWELNSDCTGSGRDADRREALDSFVRFIALVEGDAALLRRNAEDLDMARNHRLELEEAGAEVARGAPARAGSTRPEAAELLRRSKLSLARRLADHEFAVAADLSQPAERRAAARSSAVENYQLLVSLASQAPGVADTLELAMAEIARRRLDELRRRPLPATTVARDAAPTGTAAPPPTSASSPPLAASGDRPARSRGWGTARRAGIALVAAGVALGGLGGALWGVGATQVSDAQAAPTLQDRYERIETGNAFVAGGAAVASVGAAALIAGIVAAAVPARDRPVARLAPLRGGLAIQGRF